MSNVVIGIHPIHRQLAEIVEYNIDSKGFVQIDEVFMKQVSPLLRQNYDLVREHDELKHLAFLVHTTGDRRWQLEVQRRIDALQFEFRM